MDTPTTLNNAARRPAASRRKYVLVGLAMFALTVALFYAEENWRGKRAWNKYKLQFEAKGKSLDWSDHIPPLVPDEQNIFKAPGMQPYIRGKGKDRARENASWDTLRKPVPPKELLIANVQVVAPSITDIELAGTHQAASPAEVVDEIERHASRRAFGAVGITLVPNALAEARPLQIALRSEEIPTKEDLSKLLPDFSVRPSSSNAFQIILKDAVSAEDYLGSRSLEDEWKPLATALERPFARIDGDYRRPHEILLPNFVAIRSLAQILTQQTQSFLLLGKPEEALARLTLVQRARALLERPPARRPLPLVSAMISVAINGLYVSVIQDGLRLEAWGDAELAALGEQLRAINLLPMVNESLNSELVAHTHTAHTVPLSELFSLGEDRKKWGFDLLPRGWTYQNMITYAQMMEQQIESVESTLPLVAPRKIDKAAESIETNLARFSPYIYLARLGVPNTRKALRTTARVQTRVRQAEIVCALERYRLAHGSYPADLDQLVPRFLPALPRGIFDGKAPRYRRISDREFLLYSIGWNEKDDAGQTGADWQQGDWSWRDK